jgi:hypothetical protein
MKEMINCTEKAATTESMEMKVTTHFTVETVTINSLELLETTRYPAGMVMTLHVATKETI